MTERAVIYCEKNDNAIRNLGFLFTPKPEMYQRITTQFFVR